MLHGNQTRELGILSSGFVSRVFLHQQQFAAAHVLVAPEPSSGGRVVSCVWSRLVCCTLPMWTLGVLSVCRTALPASAVTLGVWAQPAFVAAASPRFDRVTRILHCVGMCCCRHMCRVAVGALSCDMGGHYNECCALAGSELSPFLAGDCSACCHQGATARHVCTGCWPVNQSGVWPGATGLL